MPERKHLILYDGVCALCNALVRFVLPRDRKDRFRFAPLQGETARGLLR
ncbi:MAG TPA: DCC1-like thiol-disulfide oxidoreductase family protein, partial [Planctomycetota bacterium]